MSATHNRICSLIKDPRLDETTRRRYAIWAVEQVAHRVRIPACIHAFEMAKRNVNGEATDDELEAAFQAAHDSLPRDVRGRPMCRTTADKAAWAMVGTASRFQDVNALVAAGEAARVVVMHRLPRGHSEMDYDLAVEEEQERHWAWLQANVKVPAKRAKKAKKGGAR